MNINWIKVFFRVLIIAFFFVIEYALTYWNTDTFLIGKSDYIAVSPDIAYGYKGFRYEDNLPIVDSFAQLNNMDEYNAFFMGDVTFEPTGYYMLLDKKFEGTIRKGKTHNIMPRDYFTQKDILIRLYRGMYGQFYIVTLKDQSKVLTLVNCIDEKSITKQEYNNIITVKQSVIPISDKVSKENEIYQNIIELMNDTELKGYIDMSDRTWADRHSFGVFGLDALKAGISFIITLVLLVLVSMITGKDIE